MRISFYIQRASNGFVLSDDEEKEVSIHITLESLISEVQDYCERKITNWEIQTK